MSVGNIEQVAIVGLGLLGASLGLALQKTSVKRLGWDRKASVRQWSLDNNAVDCTNENLREILQQADLTVLCLPIPVIKSFLKDYAADFKKGSVVTDIGSDKGVIVSTGEQLLAPYGVHFIGSHPMAGTEKNGCGAAFAELYDNAEIFVTCTSSSDSAALDKVERFWRMLPIASVRRIEPELHDDLVAHTSHISHLLALALTLSVLDCESPEEEALRYSGCATGFRDTSRIVSSSPQMWREIIENNQTAVVTAARKCEKIYRKIISAVEQGDFEQFEQLFGRGKFLRDQWMEYKKLQKKSQDK